MHRALISLACLAGLVAPARAEPWYRGKYGKNRVTNVAITGVSGLAFVLTETYWKPSLVAGVCRWCGPTSVDLTVRNAVVWHDTNGAALASNLTGYVAEPALMVGLTLYASVDTNGEPLRAQLIDDLVPVFETVTLSQMLVQAIKFSVGRQRPYAHFGPPLPLDIDQNVSFPSGHSALAFGLATSAGVIAHRHRWKTEPYVWGLGLSLAATTAYLRMAADKHYLTDVMTGSTIGILSGLTVPLLMRRPRRDLTVVPQPNGVAIAGTF